MIKNIFEGNTLQDYTNKKWYDAYHKLLSKKMKTVSSFRAYLKVAKSKPDNTYDINYFSWDNFKETFDISSFKETNVNQDLKKEDVKKVNISLYL